MIKALGKQTGKGDGRAWMGSREPRHRDSRPSEALRVLPASPLAGSRNIPGVVSLLLWPCTPNRGTHPSPPFLLITASDPPLSLEKPKKGFIFGLIIDYAYFINKHLYTFLYRRVSPKKHGDGGTIYLTDFKRRVRGWCR